VELAAVGDDDGVEDPVDDDVRLFELDPDME